MQRKLTEKVLTNLTLRTGESRLYFWDTELTGFGVIVGPRNKSFVVQSRVNGKQRRVKIGIAGKVRDDGHTWNVARARQRAKEVIGDMASGIDLNGQRIARRNGPTLRDGIGLHVANMRERSRSERSIKTLKTELERLMPEWLDRPIVELGGPELQAVRQQVRAQAQSRIDCVNPRGQALSNRLVAHVSAVWNSLDKMHDLPGKNPASRITKGDLKPREVRIPHSGFSEWYETVETLSPVRRDLQLVALFTAIRAEGVCCGRWEGLDFQNRLLQVERAKGDKPYTVPLSDPAIAVLHRRRTENLKLFGPHGGDHGWIFPSLTRSKPHRVIPVAEPKEWRTDKKTGERVRILPGLHALRRTHNSVGMEIGILQEHREALLNHNNKGVNVKVYGRPQNWDYLAACQEQIASALLQRLGRDMI